MSQPVLLNTNASEATFSAVSKGDGEWDISAIKARARREWFALYTDDEIAVRTLLQHSPNCIPLGARILTRAAQHLEDRLEAELFGLRPYLQTEQHAMVYVKGLGLELQKASEALFNAAERLKAAGKVTPANETFKAHLYFRDKAKEILG